MNERKLLLEMIRQARRDYTSPIHSEGITHWMYRHKTDPFSLNWICHTLNLQPFPVAAWIRHATH